jgi:hypothetical protein
MGANLALARLKKKICWDFAHALLELAVWLQAGEDHAIAAGSRAVLKSRCRPLVVPNKGHVALQVLQAPPPSPSPPPPPLPPPPGRGGVGVGSWEGGDGDGLGLANC